MYLLKGTHENRNIMAYKRESMIFRPVIIAILFTFCISGCTLTKPEVWKAKDVSFTQYKAFEILPVINVSGTPITQDELSIYNTNLKDQLRKQNLQITDTPQTSDVTLNLKSKILNYGFKEIYPPTPMSTANMIRVASCTILTSLIDKSTNTILAEIKTITEYDTDISIELNANIWILKESAADVAKEVAKIMQ